MRLLYVVSMRDKAHAGLHSFVFREIKGLRALGFDIILFPIKWGQGPYMPERDWKVCRPGLIATFWAAALTLTHSPSAFLSQMWSAIRSRTVPAFLLGTQAAYLVMRHLCDGIHAHFGDHKLYTGYYAKMLAGCSLSTTIHAYELYSNPRPQLFRQALAACDGIVTVSEFNRDQLAERYGVEASKVDVVRLWVDTPPRLNRIHCGPISDSKFTIVTVGRFVEKKGYPTLIQAMADQRLNGSKLVVVGRGPLDVRSLAREFDIESRMTIHEYVTDEKLKLLYEECDVFCLPSQTEISTGGSFLDREGIPVSIMEAMACGMPVVATRHAGIPELVDRILVEERDAVGLANALASLREDPNLRRDLGRLNMKTAREKCGPGNLIALSEVLMHAHHPHPRTVHTSSGTAFPDSGGR